MNQACMGSLLLIGWSTEVRREMTKADELECVAGARAVAVEVDDGVPFA